MPQDVRLTNHHGGTCGGPSYITVAQVDDDYMPGTLIFMGHETIDGSQPAMNDPMVCGTCGEDLGVAFYPEGGF